ncbi:hypothetical protein ACFQY0_20985 [Haloferula chungangensis]|uniref:Uncharacterized protein n=1 Tax=Haloferula chungangensis TaxID=1048331 RepID=A0ABW2LED1_9BACT
MPLRLLFPPLDRTANSRPFVQGIKRPAMISPWPWRATLLTTVNCYLLWGLTWFQFVITLSCFSYSGRNLWFYALEPETFGLSVPETFLAFSIALSVFALCAVSVGTWRTPRLWKRLIIVGIFVAITLGFSCLNLHLRHYCYAQALFYRDQAQAKYHQNLVLNYDSEDEWVVQSLEWDQQIVDEYNEGIRLYREKFVLGE